jgi:hypothetical protein
VVFSPVLGRTREIRMELTDASRSRLTSARTLFFCLVLCFAFFVWALFFGSLAHANCMEADRRAELSDLRCALLLCSFAVVLGSSLSCSWLHNIAERDGRVEASAG